MKTLTILVVLLLIFTNCSSDRYTVESDYSYHSDFKKYKYFAVVSRKAVDEDSSMANPVISKEIEDRMKLQGYRTTEKKPNLLVFHKIFYTDLRFQGYHQPEMEKWVKDGVYQVEEEEEEYHAYDDKKPKYDPAKYDLKKGTLLIQFVDSRHHNVVWQGYASGLFSEDASKNERLYKRAVRSIFDQYRIFAEGFILNQKGNSN